MMRCEKCGGVLKKSKAHSLFCPSCVENNRPGKKTLGKRGQVAIYLAFIVLAIIIIVITALIAPMGVLFNIEMYKAGEKILNNSQVSLEGISDVEIREAVNESINAAKDNAQNNIEVNAAMFQYAWIVVLVLCSLVLFLYTRRIVEYGGGGLI